MVHDCRCDCKRVYKFTPDDFSSWQLSEITYQYISTKGYAEFVFSAGQTPAADFEFYLKSNCCQFKNVCIQKYRETLDCECCWRHQQDENKRKRKFDNLITQFIL